jgi:hypothetical protein
MLAGIAALLLAAPAVAGSLTLHPSGFGPHSYSAWKADEGLDDSTGAKEQALYFQKNTATTTFAAGVAVFKGVEGMLTSALGELSFYWRMDGHCGAGAPRFNLRIENNPQTFFFGCQAMAPGTPITQNGRTFQQRSVLGPLPPGTVASLALVFDEGSDVGRCDDELGVDTGESCVYLDDIQAAGHTWTSASDNGNGQTIVQSSTPLALLLGEPIELALG